MKQSPLAFYKNMSPAVRTSVWFTLCNFLQRGAACLTIPIFTRLLTTAEYGICNVYFAWFDLLIIFTSLKLPYEGLNNGLIRYGDDPDGYTSSMMGLILSLTAGAFLLSRLFQDWLITVTGLSSFLLHILMLQLLFQPALMLWTNRERFDFRYRWPVIVTLLSTIANPLIAIIAVLSTGYRAEARIISSAALQIALGLGLAILLFRRGKRFYKKEYWIFALRFNLPLLAYYLSQSLLNQSDRIMINYFSGSGSAAIYSVAYSAATLMLLLISAINGSFNPWMYKKLKSGEHAQIGQTAVRLCALIGLATLALIAFAPDLIWLLATEDYREAIWIIPPVAASVYFVFVYMVFANATMYHDKNHGIATISIICAAANVVLNAIFIPRFGYLAAGWTTLFCYMLLALLHGILMCRICRKQQVALFPLKTIILLSGGVVGMAFAMMGLYTFGYWRYFVIAAELAALFVFRKKLGATFQQIRKGADTK